MAGRRQHHIPRFLQKGFHSKKKKKQLYTYVFTREKQPYETNLINVGLENDFYGNPIHSQADKKITEEENLHVEFVESLRDIRRNQLVDSSCSSKFIAHMIIRAKHLRESICEMGSIFFDTFHNGLKQQDSFAGALTLFIKNNRRMVAKKIQESLPANLNKEQRILVTKYLLDNPQKWTSELSSKFQDEFLTPLSLFSQKVPELVKNSHIQVLEKDTVSEVFLEITKDYSWKIFFYKNHTLILGDVGAIGSFLPKGDYRSLIFFKRDLQSVYLPISKNHLLVGSPAIEEIQSPLSAKINEAFSRLSREYFISSNNDTQTQNLANCLGEESLIVQGDVNKLAKKMQTELFGK